MPIMLQEGSVFCAAYLLLLLAHLCLVRPPSVTICEIDAIKGARIGDW
jgi:hypothetical protein